MTEPERPATGLRVLAVDDEPPALGELVYLLEHARAVREVTAASSAAEALTALRSQVFDAVFLDIRMPGIDGLALAGVLARFASPPPVVFVTAYDSHAVDAFELAAVDYLLKPVRAERLAQALDRVEVRLEQQRSATSEPDQDQQVPAPAPAPVAGPPADETIAVELGGVTRYVRRSEVVYVEAQRDYVRLCTRTAGHLVRVPLATLEERWGPLGFVRVHRRHLVNTRYVEALRTAAGMTSVDLGADQSVPVSRRFNAEVKAVLVRRHRLDREPPSPTSPAGPAPGGGPGGGPGSGGPR